LHQVDARTAARLGRRGLPARFAGGYQQRQREYGIGADPIRKCLQVGIPATAPDGGFGT
jgi:hypothetical protein